MKKGKIRNNFIKMTILSLICANSISFASKQNDYNKQISSVEDVLNHENNEFISMLDSNDIQSVNMVAVGNSISFGYSAKDDIIPLLLRNEKLANDPRINMYHYSRAQFNCDGHFLEYMSKDYHISDINSIVRNDLSSETSGLNHDYITQQQIDEYYPLTLDYDPTLSELISEDDSVNIIIYNGDTGLFLDRLTINGDFSYSAFEEELYDVDYFCKNIYLNNSKTQIYLCGIPKYLNIGLSDALVNNKIKEIADRYTNVTYVEPAASRVLYDTENGLQGDMHYNKDEYLILNKNIINSINENYVSNMLATEIYKSLIELSADFEFNDIDNRFNMSMVEELINGIFNKYPNLTDEDKKKAIEKIKPLFEKDFGSYFVFLPKEETLQFFDEITKNKQKKYTMKNE